MDDEAASQQLMSEARATPHLSDYDGPAIPLNLDASSQNLPSTSRSLPKKTTKKPRKQHLAPSQIPRTFRSSPLPTYSRDELQAAAVDTPSKSRAFLSATPSTQTKVPNTQTDARAKDGPTPTPSNASKSASRDPLKTSSGKDRKRSQAAAGLDNNSATSSNPYGGLTGEVLPPSSQMNRKRRKKDRPRNSSQNAELDSMRVSETPAATQEVATQASAEGGNNVAGMQDFTLTPSDLLGKLHLEKSQPSQNGEGPPSPANVHVDALETTHQHPKPELELPDASYPVDAVGSTGASQSDKKREKAKEDKHAAKPSVLESKAHGHGVDGASAAPSSSKESSSGAMSRRKEKFASKKKARYSVGGIPGKPRISKADPNKTYQRADDDNDRTAADSALEEMHELGHPPDKRLGGDYTADEKELLRRAIRDYQERNSIDTGDLVEIIQWTNRNRVKMDKQQTVAQTEAQFQKDCDAFWDDIKSAGLLRKLRDIKRHVRSRYHTCQRGQWSQDEDEQLRDLFNRHPGQWKLIATHLNRLEKDTFAHWRDYVRHGENRVTKRWTIDEEENLVRVLSAVCQKVEDNRAETGQPPLDDYYPVINWHEVCKRIGDTRSRLQCQSKWKLMCARVPPAALDVEVKPRAITAPNEATLETLEHRRKPTATRDRNPEVTAADRHLPGPEDMLWGDKVDLITCLVEHRMARSLEWSDDVAWREIAKSMGPIWSVHTLQKAYEQLCELVLGDVTNDLGFALNSIIAYLNADVAANSEQEKRYQPAQNVEINEEDAAPAKSSMKRKRQSGATPGKERVKKQSKNPSSSAKVFKSEELIVDSEPEL